MNLDLDPVALASLAARDDGRTWLIGAGAMRVAADGRLLLSRLLLHEELFAAAARRELEGAHGERVAALLDLPAAPGLTDAFARWWARDRTFVIERDDDDGAIATLAASARADGLDALGDE